MTKTTCLCCGAKCEDETTRCLDWAGEVTEISHLKPVQPDLTKLREAYDSFVTLSAFCYVKPQSYAIDLAEVVKELLEQEVKP